MLGMNSHHFESEMGYGSIQGFEIIFTLFQLSVSKEFKFHVSSKYEG